jgi:hypothetical protein
MHGKKKSAYMYHPRSVYEDARTVEFRYELAE